MKRKMQIYFLWILVITNLFYAEKWGLNALIIAVITVLVFAWKENRLFSKKESGDKNENSAQWWLAAFVWMVAAVGVFLKGTPFIACMYVITFFYFTSLQQQFRISVPLGMCQAIQSMGTGLVRFFENLYHRPGEEQPAGSRKWMRPVLLFMIPLIILIVFLKLYQVADPRFYELTKFINLDWISWGFIFSYALLMIVFWGFYFFRPEDTVSALESSLKNEIKAGYSDKVQHFFGETNERKSALVLLSALNVMLILYLLLDLNILSDATHPDSFYSVALHSGVNALIFSIVLVIVLVTYLFRGALNFTQNKNVKWLAISWLILNCVLVFTTALKNYDYVLMQGLTYKRLGVYLYLFLCLAGLLFTIYKIFTMRSAWFMARNMIMTTMVVFSLVPLFNWDRIITRFNVTHIREEYLDLEYLYALGGEAYPDLMDYHLGKGMTQTDLFDRLSSAMMAKTTRLEMDRGIYTWRSFVYYDSELLARLKQYQVHLKDEHTGPGQVANR